MVASFVRLGPPTYTWSNERRRCYDVEAVRASGPSNDSLQMSLLWPLAQKLRRMLSQKRGQRNRPRCKLRGEFSAVFYNLFILTDPASQQQSLGVVVVNQNCE